MFMQIAEQLKNYTSNDSEEAQRNFFSPPLAKKSTQVETLSINQQAITRFTNEFWTAKQRQAANIHEVSYRACYKPQLPRFFIERLTKPGELVYDPFSGRGTTVIEAGLLGRNVISNDINPLSEILCRPRFFIPNIMDLQQRLNQIPIDVSLRADLDLSMFYELKTEAEIVSLRNYLESRRDSAAEDHLDRWIRMVATNRLSGHSKGFFSVYSLPPNQAVTQDSQRKINERLKQQPEYRDVFSLINKKSKSLLQYLTPEQCIHLKKTGMLGVFLNEDARRTSHIPERSVQLTVTSPPFLDVVDYRTDNWLRCWFNALDVQAVAAKLTIVKKLEQWCSIMGDVFIELWRITKPGGWVAFEVGEIRKGTVRLDEYVVPLGLQAGFRCEGIVINAQEFTKTAHIWGVDNNSSGTNTNRIVLFQKQ